MPRNYKREYAAFHKKPKNKKIRYARTNLRLKLIKLGLVAKGDGKIVSLKDGNINNLEFDNIIIKEPKNERP